MGVTKEDGSDQDTPEDKAVTQAGTPNNRVVTSNPEDTHSKADTHKADTRKADTHKADIHKVIIHKVTLKVTHKVVFHIFFL